MSLWESDDVRTWREALASYDGRIASREVNRLPELDRWYRLTFPRLLESRNPPFIAKDELINVTDWKMKRGVYRGRNIALVRRNTEADVKSISEQAFAAIPDVRKPISLLRSLSGVGPATASAILAALRPELFPFFDEDVARQIPDLGKVAFTPGYYFRYSAALRSRARRLTEASRTSWTAQDIAQALWARSIHQSPSRSAL